MRILPVLFSLLLFTSLMAQTEVSGSVEGEWTVDESPFIVIDDITVESDDQLEIEPGVQVLFDGAYRFLVNGLLTAVGSEEDSIVFSRNDEDIRWRGLRIISGDDDTQISYCIIEHSQTVGGDQDMNARGAGIFCSDTDALISHNTIRFNEAAGFTGGIYTIDCDADVLHNHIHDNEAYTNGAVEIDNSNATISHNIVERNRSRHGGGMLFYRGAPTVEYNIIRENESWIMDWGSGLYFAWSCEAEVRYNLIADNDGGGVYAGASARISVFENNTIVNNPGRCGILVYQNSSSINMTNCILFGHDDPIYLEGGRLSAEYSNIENLDMDEIQLGEGVIDEDPLFVDPDEGDYHLSPDSPCIDTGDPDSDPDPDDSRADMGCFWYGALIALEVTPDTLEFGYISVNEETVETISIIYQSVEEDPEPVEVVITVEGDEDWFTLEPVNAEMEAGDTLNVELTVIRPVEEELGQRTSVLIICPNEIERAEVELPVSAFLVEGFGQLRGSVTDAENNEPMPDLTINLEDTEFEAVTDEAGNFAFADLPAGDYFIQMEVDEYLTYAANLIVEPNEETVRDIALLHATCEVEQEEIILDIKPDSSSEYNVLISNSGNGPLAFTAELRYGAENEFEPWQLRRQIDAAMQSRDNTLQGIAFDGENFFVSGSNNREGRGLIHQFSSEGGYVTSFDQFIDSRWAIRGLTFDGSMLWGADGSAIFGFTPEGDLEEQFEGPLDLNRAMTWDEANNLLWICNLEEDIIAIDIEGNEVIRFERDPAPRIFGLATYPEDPDSCTIYAFCLEGEFGTQVNKMNPETGEWLFVADLETHEDYMAGGMFITELWDTNSWVMAGILRGEEEVQDIFGLWNVGIRKSWIGLGLESGEVEADSSSEIPLLINAENYSADMELSAELIIDHNGRGNRIRLPITLIVTYDIEDDDPNDEFPHGFILSEPYPNPFNSSINISFTLPAASLIHLELLDTTGRRVRTEDIDELPGGHHRISLSADGLASGVYLLSLDTGSEIALRKVVLIR